MSPASSKPKQKETSYALRVQRMAAARIALRDRSPVLSILVVGTGKYDLEAAELGVARTVGRELARWGFALITGGWQGVDYVTAEAYAQQLATNDISPYSGLLQVVTRGTQPVFRQGSTLNVRGEGWIPPCIELAEAVVAIGGAGATLEVCRQAAGKGKIVIPVPGTGGDADIFFSEMTEEARRELAPLDRHLDSNGAYYEVAQALVELLLKKLPLPSKRAYEPAT